MGVMSRNGTSLVSLIKSLFFNPSVLVWLAKRLGVELSNLGSFTWGIMVRAL